VNADFEPRELDVDALRTYDWPGDLGEVWEVTRWIAAIEAAGWIRRAAKVRAVPRTTLQGWLQDRRLSTPPTAGGRWPNLS
jgi:hypothetical protein